MRRDLEKYFRAELKRQEGKTARLPKIDHKHWASYVYLKRYNILPHSGGWKQQPYGVIAYFNIVMHVEGLIYGQKRKHNKSSGRIRKGRR